MTTLAWVVAAVAALPGTSSAPEAVRPAALLGRYQPVVVLHPDERFRPVSVDGFLADARLERRAADGTWVDEAPGSAPLPRDPFACAGASCWRLKLPACTASVGVASLECYRRLEAARAPPSVVYGAVHRRGARIALQYWYWYSYNFWSGEHPPSDYVWQAHEGDWELVTVVLDRSGRPLFAGYSEHGCGKRRAWRAVPKWRRTRHPVVHVALGSHANSYAARPFPIDLRPGCYPELGAALLRTFLHPPLDRVGAGPRLGPRLAGVLPTRIVRLTESTPAWTRFPGAWGEANYFHVPEPVGTAVEGLGPVGPRFKRIWRDPIGVPLAWPRG